MSIFYVSTHRWLLSPNTHHQSNTRKFILGHLASEYIHVCICIRFYKFVTLPNFNIHNGTPSTLICNHQQLEPEASTLPYGHQQPHCVMCLLQLKGDQDMEIHFCSGFPALPRIHTRMSSLAPRQEQVLAEGNGSPAPAWFTRTYIHPVH